MYVNDSELPEQIQQEIRRILSAKGNLRRRMNVEDERDIDEDMRVDEMNDEDLNGEFEWGPMSEWRGVKETFIPETSGPTRSFNNAYEAFSSHHYIGRGSHSEPSSTPTSVQTVLRLVRPLLHLGHTLYMDNWFNSPILARWLRRQKTDWWGHSVLLERTCL